MYSRRDVKSEEKRVYTRHKSGTTGLERKKSDPPCIKICHQDYS